MLKSKFPFFDSPIILASLHHRTSPTWSSIKASITSCIVTDLFADSSAITHHRRAFEKANWPGYRASLSSSFQSVLNEVNHTIDQPITNALTVAADSNIPTTVVGPHRKHWWSVIPGIPAALPNFAVRTAARPATNPLLSVILGLKPVQNGKT